MFMWTFNSAAGIFVETCVYRLKLTCILSVYVLRFFFYIVCCPRWEGYRSDYRLSHLYKLVFFDKRNIYVYDLHKSNV